MARSVATGLTLLASLLLRPAAGMELPELGGVHAVLHFPEHPGFSLPVGERVRGPPTPRHVPLVASRQRCEPAGLAYAALAPAPWLGLLPPPLNIVPPRSLANRSTPWSASAARRPTR